MAVQPLTPEELHYGRAVYASVHAETALPFDKLSNYERRHYCDMAAAARSAPAYTKPGERLYESLMNTVGDHSERTSPREDRAIVYAVARWLVVSSATLAPSDISDLYDLAKERVK